MSEKKPPGPEPDRLQIDTEDWEDAVGRALNKPRPADGWPSHKSHQSGDDAKKPEPPDAAES